MEEKKIPYKIYLSEDEMPRAWYNVRADMKNKPAPLLDGETMQPITLEKLSEVFCEELARQEMDENTAFFCDDFQFYHPFQKQKQPSD